MGHISGGKTVKQTTDLNQRAAIKRLIQLVQVALGLNEIC
jgi:hypothetical protein